jgi:large subunit ribosomal protein L33
MLTYNHWYDILSRQRNRAFFLCLKKSKAKFSDKALQEKSEVDIVRVKITLACTDCKQRNYNMTKEKKTHPDRMETKKYCKFCRSHTMHKETK